MRGNLFFATFALAGLLMAQSPEDLSSYRWQNRLLLLFAGDPALTNEQKKTLAAHEPGFRERDLLRFEYAPDQASALRKRYGVPAFGVVLIGKDGSAKLVRKRPVTADEIFRLIDSMPMRKQEMRQR